ncbi:MAG: hypothetical protein L6V91_08540 [Bacilli bacterium]|nr:MAG: hypothetical protein L6V91_08540 [Bacilli bacterium]
MNETIESVSKTFFRYEKNRIDKELVERQLITSRTRAQELIESGYVKCNDKIIYKCNYLVSESDKLEIIKK